MGLETCLKKLSTQLQSRMKEQLKEIKKKKEEEVLVANSSSVELY